jgi:hypothetical protein
MATAHPRPEAEPEPEAKASGPKQVRYIGAADARMIQKAEWAAIGIEAEVGTAWTADNSYTVPTKDLNKDQMAYLSTDADFVVRSSDDDEPEERTRLLQKRFSAGGQQTASFIDNVKGGWIAPQRVVYEGPANPPADLT